MEKNISEKEEAVKKFKELVKDVSVCMFTTVDDHNNLYSRPMSTVNIDDEGNAWFFTNEFSETIQEVSKDNNVHLIYAHPAKNVYVTVKGSCTVILNRKKIDELWTPLVEGLVSQWEGRSQIMPREGGDGGSQLLEQ